MPRVRSRVYLGRLSHRASQRDVERFFKGFGELVDIQLKNGYGFVDFADPRDAEDAVHEKNGRDLCGERVIVELARGTPHGRDLDRDRGHRHRRNRSLSRSRSRSRSPRRRSRSRSPRRPARRHSKSRSRSRSHSSRSRSKSRTPSVKRDCDPGEVRSNWRLDVDNLAGKVSWKDLKEHCGKGGRVVYAEMLTNGKGFVEFANEADLLDAVRSLDNTELFGRSIRVSVGGANGKGKSRSRTKSASRSRSRSRSRSHTRSRSRSRSVSPAKANGNGKWNGNNSNEGDESAGN